MGKSDFVEYKTGGNIINETFAASIAVQAKLQRVIEYLVKYLNVSLTLHPRR